MVVVRPRNCHGFMLKVLHKPSPQLGSFRSHPGDAKNSVAKEIGELPQVEGLAVIAFHPRGFCLLDATVIAEEGF